jgi:carbamoyltransferase
MITVPQDIPSGSVLGINYGGLHDSAIALVAPNGTPLFCMSLERLSRSKQDGRPPYALLEHMPWQKIAKVAMSNGLLVDPHHQTTSPLLTHAYAKPRAYGRFSHPAAYHDFITKVPCEVVEVCHHMAHTASAFWGSGFDEALCLTYDGGVYSNPWFGGLYHANRRDGVTPRDMFNRFYYPEIASLYSFITALLGFTPNRHEGKLTGLAAYGIPTDACRAMITQWFADGAGMNGQTTRWLFAHDAQTAPVAYVDDDAMQPYRAMAQKFSREEIATTLQEFCEHHMLALLTKARAMGWTNKKICLSGGVFANVRINQRIAESGIEDIFIVPPMTDDGTALGAAWHVLAADKNFASRPLTSVYLGASYAHDEKVLTENKINFEKVPDPAKKIAEILADGKIIAVFQGAMEFGPRALGNRSILSQATEPDINKTLNARLNRTEFMPFAPVTREEDAAACYKNLDVIRRTASFMTVTADCTETMKQLCPAVVHVDGTARPQILRRDNNPLIHDILTHYKALTGCPALVNTSFNIHEEPIVCSPYDALKGFFESGLDYLFIGSNTLIALENNSKAAIQFLEDKRAAEIKKAETLRTVTRKRTLDMENRERILHQRITEQETEIAALKVQVQEYQLSRGYRLVRIGADWVRRMNPFPDTKSGNT